MSTAHATIEIPTVNAHVVEKLYRRAMDKQDARDFAYLARGNRALTARDPKMLKVLEKASEVMHAKYEAQLGQTHRASRDATATVEGVRYKGVPTEVQIVIESYRTLDKGDPLPHFGWWYAAVAEFVFG